MDDGLNPQTRRLFEVIDKIRELAPDYAQAKANRIYLTEFRKVKKALLMRESGEKAQAHKETEAYAHPDYLNVLTGLAGAVEQEERLRWEIVACEAEIEALRTTEATRRAESRI